MGGVIGGFVGNSAGEGYRTRAAGYAQDAANLWNDLQVPTIESQELNLLTPEYLGDFQAQMEQAQSLGPSAMENIAVDPRLAQAQMGALEQLSQMGEVGLLPGERAALNQARRAAASEAQAKSAQLMDEYARRGVGGSGAELAARLQAGQSAADRQSQESDRLMQMAQERALSSISNAGNLAGQISNQQFGQQSDVAKAKDYINQFNIQNQQNVQQRNVAGANQAGLRNLQEQQRIAEQGTGIKNQQQQYNKGLIQQQFQNQTQKIGGQTGQLANLQNLNNQQAGRTADMWSNIGKGVDQGVAAYFGVPTPEDKTKKG